jgi:restriction system protein
LYGVVSAEGANKGILITSSAFTKGAEEFAQGKPIELIDGDQLERLIEEYLVRNEAIS